MLKSYRLDLNILLSLPGLYNTFKSSFIVSKKQKKNIERKREMKLYL